MCSPRDISNYIYALYICIIVKVGCPIKTLVDSGTSDSHKNIEKRLYLSRIHYSTSSFFTQCPHSVFFYQEAIFFIVSYKKRGRMLPHAAARRKSSAANFFERHRCRLFRQANIRLINHMVVSGGMFFQNFVVLETKLMQFFIRCLDIASTFSCQIKTLYGHTLKWQHPVNAFLPEKK